MVEPTACAVHAALAAPAAVAGGDRGRHRRRARSGLCTVAALRRFALPGTRHRRRPSTPSSAGWPPSSGADRRGRARRAAPGRAPGQPGSLVARRRPADRRRRRRLRLRRHAPSRSPTALAVVRPGGPGRPASGMPGQVARRPRPAVAAGGRSSSAPTPTAPSAADRAAGADLRPGLSSWSPSAGLGRLVSATYPLDRYAEAIEHAGDAGRRGAVKIAFDADKIAGTGSPAATTKRRAIALRVGSPAAELTLRDPRRYTTIAGSRFLTRAAVSHRAGPSRHRSTCRGRRIGVAAAAAPTRGRRQSKWSSPAGRRQAAEAGRARRIQALVCQLSTGGFVRHERRQREAGSSRPGR